MKKHLKIFILFILSLFLITFTACNKFADIKKSDSAGSIKGKVELTKQMPLSNYDVTLYSYDGMENKVVSKVYTDTNGNFNLKFKNIQRDMVYYILATNKKNPKLNLISVLGDTLYKEITINPLTTIASTFVTAQFIDKTKFSGDLKPLKIAMNNAPNLVNPITGSWGEILLNGENSTESTTLARLNTLANLIIRSFEDPKVYNQFTQTINTPNTNSDNIVSSFSNFTKYPWYNSEKIFNLFVKVYPRGTKERKTPLKPYLEFVPDDFSMMVRFSGGGIFSPGKLVLDKDGNIWTGQNWMPGSQSNTLRGLGGGLVALYPNGKPFSPPITGFEGSSEIGGIGWGTAMGKDKVWIDSFEGKAIAYDFTGKPYETKVVGEVGNFMGIYASPVNGDIWIADGKKGQMIKFENGDPQKGKVVKVPGLRSPFSVVVDKKNRVWVGNSAANYVTMFPSEHPEKAVNYIAGGISVRGLTVDNDDFVWANSSISMNVKLKPIDPSLSIMEQFTQLGRALVNNYPQGSDKVTGSTVKLDPNNPKKPLMIISGKKSKISGPWGVSIDGENHLWVANFLNGSVLNFATKDIPKFGLKKGDLIHKYESGIIQMVTDSIVDYSGNIWIANNWNDEQSVVGFEEKERSSTKGGGSGIVVIYGAAKPVPMK